LPFERRDAQFKVSLSRPDAPFLISVGIYGGGGYLALIGNGKSIVGFEASFEFGGVSAFAFGPLNGIGRLTTGIFVRKIGPSTTIEGFFFAGGAARVACFGVAASLVVRISMQPGGAMAGQAIFTFSFSLGLAHLDFHVPVWKTQAALGGGSAGLSIEPPTRYAERAQTDVRETAKVGSKRRLGRMQTYVETVTPERNWTRYSGYFDQTLHPMKDE
jgi:hypothetical protein